MRFRIPKIGVILFVLGAVLVLRFWSPFPFLQDVTRALLFPAIQLVRIPVNGIGGAISQIITLRGAQQENAIFVKELKDLNVRISFLEGVESENRRLRSVLGFSTRPFVLRALLAADVLERNPDMWFHMVEIGKGESQGVRVGMVAVTPEGVVGHVRSVGQHSAQVQLITDPDSSIPSSCERTQELGLLKGSGTGTLHWRYIPADSDVQIGDLIQSSGASTMYPEGLRLGTVVHVKNPTDDLFQVILARPAVNYSTLRSLFLISTR